MNNDILDFYMPTPATFGNVYNKLPPLNDFGIGTYIAIAGLIASAAGSYVSYETSQKQAKQADMNAEAQSNALNQEAARQRQVLEENQRRLAIQQQRQRAQQLAQIADSGIMAGTGTALALEADTWAQNQRDLNDNQYLSQLNQNQLTYEAGNALALGQQQASQYKAAGNAALVSGAASVLGGASNLNFSKGSGNGGKGTATVTAINSTPAASTSGK